MGCDTQEATSSTFERNLARFGLTHGLVRVCACMSRGARFPHGIDCFRARVADSRTELFVSVRESRFSRTDRLMWSEGVGCARVGISARVLENVKW